MQTFEVLLLDEASKFILKLPLNVRIKILYNIDKVSCGNWNNELFKKLDGTEIWEFRTLYKGIAYRLFAFWDTNKKAFVVATHGIIKKTQKTPKKEIEKAERIRLDYLKMI